MKKQITLALACLISLSMVKAQSFSDDFESYTVGSFLAASSPNWVTWSGPTGGAEDVKITDNDAASGTKSIYLSSSATNGGPQDIVLPFGAAYSTGHFTFTSKFKVLAGKTAYFNFQATQTIGQTWAMNCSMMEDGTMYFDNNTDILLMSNYPQDSWFTLKIEIDLTNSLWEVFFDNISIGTFNITNQIASLNIYPINNLSAFYVDDVSYFHSTGASIKKENKTANQMAIYPNPAKDNAFLSMNLKEEADIKMSVYQINGALVYSKNYGKISGKQNLPIETANLNAGIYFVNVIVDGHPTMMKFILE
jgi:hypothetical protein